MSRPDNDNASYNNNNNSRRQKGARQPRQRISVLAWYKDDQLDAPIFSVDARESSSLLEAKQQTHAEELRGRARLEERRQGGASISAANPALVIDEAQAADAGLYRCTVEFSTEPTQTFEVRVALLSE